MVTSAIMSVQQFAIYLVTVAVTICHSGCYAQPGDGPRACHLPGDLVFVLDESGSIWGPAFKQQLEFVELVADTFTISSENTHIGVLTFASDTNVIFHLDTYDNRFDVKQAIRGITQRRGGTQTHKALAEMRETMFSTEHSRLTAAHVAIVITDGESEEPEETALQAELAHQQDIIVIAIGVGPHVMLEELAAIASTEDLVFTAPDYAALQPLLNQLAWKACEVRTTTTTTTTPPPPMIAGCASQTPVDIIWTLPNEANSQNTVTALQLVSIVAKDLEIGPTSVQVGVAPRVCGDDQPAIRLKDHDTLEGFHFALSERHLANTTNVNKQLEYLRTQGFSARSGARPEAAKVALVVVDRRSTDLDLVKLEVTKAHRVGIRLIVVGVGSNVNPAELAALSPNDHIIRVDSYDDLSAIQVQLVQHICSVIRTDTKFRRRKLYEYGLFDN